MCVRFVIIVNDCPSQTTMRYRLTLVGMAIINKSESPGRRGSVEHCPRRSPVQFLVRGHVWLARLILRGRCTGAAD